MSFDKDEFKNMIGHLAEDLEKMGIKTSLKELSQEELDSLERAAEKMESIEKDIASGASFNDICKKYSDSVPEMIYGASLKKEEKADNNAEAEQKAEKCDLKDADIKDAEDKADNSSISSFAFGEEFSKFYEEILKAADKKSDEESSEERSEKSKGDSLQGKAFDIDKILTETASDKKEFSLKDVLTPKQVTEALDRYIIGQNKAKKAVAVALRNRYRRQCLEGSIREEIIPKNILMIGPTGVGKTEIARRLAKLVGAPFVKAEATKYTEVGYVGRDVESMIRDLASAGFRMAEQNRLDKVKEQAQQAAAEKIAGVILKKDKKTITESLKEAFSSEKKEKKKTEDKQKFIRRVFENLSKPLNTIFSEAEHADLQELKTAVLHNVWEALEKAFEAEDSSDKIKLKFRIFENLSDPIKKTFLPYIKQDGYSDENMKLQRRVIDTISDALAKTFEADEKENEDIDKEKLKRLILDGSIADRLIEIDIEDEPNNGNVHIAAVGGEEMGMHIQDMLGGLFAKKRSLHKITVERALEVITAEESHKLIDHDEIKREAVRLVENSGILFLDEIDKVAGKEGGHGPDVSRQGVQRDILPIVEGCAVNTKIGTIHTEHILFIAAGAFHESKPSDLIPELQGRFPIRVELESLKEEDFRRILTEPDNSLTRQYCELLKTEGVEVEFTDEGVDELARLACHVNEQTENIGARRLHTLLERVLEKVSFEAPDLQGQKIVIDRKYVLDELEDIAESRDLSRYIL